ncbi:hypothetical protein [Curtobacterium oceanosedimentum]|uniref:Lipoprotein n=1 Tax=Curtobacterium oceanosedimentum TaxID=465820 RepID=A0A147DPG2_9MICO|nr:hypothetical protein [Curtobacterium oceanosedimentum]KTR51332.1 hypothetical protein NS359_10770 [Curtobacterium oceanosedimentum]
MKKIGTVIAVLAAFLLTACAVSSEGHDPPERRLLSAKDTTRAAERSLLDLVPANEVESVQQPDDGAVLQCGSKYQWSGNVRIGLAPGTRATEARDALARAASDHGFSVSKDEMLSGDVRYEMFDDNRVQLIVTVWNDGSALNVDSGSPCFDLPSDFDVPLNY